MIVIVNDHGFAPQNDPHNRGRFIDLTLTQRKSHRSCSSAAAFASRSTALPMGAALPWPQGCGNAATTAISGSPAMCWPINTLWRGALALMTSKYPQDFAARQPEPQWLARADWRAHDYQSRLRRPAGPSQQNVESRN